MKGVNSVPGWHTQCVPPAGTYVFVGHTRAAAHITKEDSAARRKLHWTTPKFIFGGTPLCALRHGNSAHLIRFAGLDETFAHVLGLIAPTCEWRSRAHPGIFFVKGSNN
jgi:hypothetical protein